MKMADQQPNDEPKSITNICYDCLERIFDFLDLESLLNVAGTCKQLQIAAAAKFGHDHGGKEVRLDIRKAEKPDLLLKEGIQFVFGRIRVTGSKLCLSFLRCFGAKIPKLTVIYQIERICFIIRCFQCTIRSDRLDHYITEYCANTLTHIEFKYQMPGIKNIEAKSIDWRRQLWNGMNWFLGLYRLETSQHAVEYFLAKRQLENYRKPFENVSEVGITSVHLGNHLPDLAILFSNLRTLNLDCVTVDKSTIAVHFPHLTELSLICLKSTQNGLWSEFFINILRANPQLQKLTICRFDLFTLNNILDMINGNPSLSRFAICGGLSGINVDAAEVDRLVSKRSFMDELALRTYQFTVDDAIILISQLNWLKRFEFLVRDQPECDRLLNQLDGDWKFRHYDVLNGIVIKLER